ncbi:hypothetical protein DFH06DRAFT_1246749 [Mycena polygramma]|nr:hypothetical protein DFH06DRAFT_1246749 [Mycena polygramma]
MYIERPSVRAYVPSPASPLRRRIARGRRGRRTAGEAQGLERVGCSGWREAPALQRIEHAWTGSPPIDALPLLSHVYGVPAVRPPTIDTISTHAAPASDHGASWRRCLALPVARADFSVRVRAGARPRSLRRYPPPPAALRPHDGGETTYNGRMEAMLHAPVSPLPAPALVVACPHTTTQTWIQRVCIELGSSAPAPCWG